jgi:repressor LexA
MQARTRRQREVLDFITGFIDSHGYRPSYSMIARNFGLRSRGGIVRIVSELESQGLLTRERIDGHFSIEVKTSENGRVSSGGVLVDWLDAPTVHNREPWEMQPVVLPEFMLGYQTTERIRAFRVVDDALERSGIKEDDIALIELRKFVRDGTIVVAVVDGNATYLRKYYRSGSEIELRAGSDSPEENNIRRPADHVEILGVYRTHIRPIA